MVEEVEADVDSMDKEGTTKATTKVTIVQKPKTLEVKNSKCSSLIIP